MDEPLGTFSQEHCVILGCPVRDERLPCSIPLPRQSQLGIYEGLHYRPTSEWQEIFLCLRDARSFVCSPRNIHLQVEQRPPHLPVPPLWMIECECGHKNCGKPHTIYTAREKDWPAIVRLILERDPSVRCDGHDLVWREDLMRGTEIAHDPPLR